METLLWTDTRTASAHSSSSNATAAQQQQQCAVRLRRTIISNSDGSAAFKPEADVGAGKRVAEVESSDHAVKVVSKPLGARVAASQAAAGFVACKQSSCTHYKSQEPDAIVVCF